MQEVARCALEPSHPRKPYAVSNQRLKIQPMTWRTFLVLVGLAVVSTSCNYFSNRTRDFFEVFRAQGGFGRGLGATARAAGVLDIGLNTPGAFPHSSGVGLVYGDPYFLSGDKIDVDFMRLFHDETIGVVYGGGDYEHSHKCWALLPAAFARVDRIDAPDFPESADHEDWLEGPMLWSEAALELDPWAHVHAFDAEVGLYLLLVNAKVGLSPGEAVDFLLGLFGVDIAQDDVVETYVAPPRKGSR